MKTKYDLNNPMELSWDRTTDNWRRAFGRAVALGALTEFRSSTKWDPCTGRMWTKFRMDVYRISPEWLNGKTDVQHKPKAEERLDLSNPAHVPWAKCSDAWRRAYQKAIDIGEQRWCWMQNRKVWQTSINEPGDYAAEIAYGIMVPGMQQEHTDAGTRIAQLETEVKQLRAELVAANDKLRTAASYEEAYKRATDQLASIQNVFKFLLGKG